MPISKFPASSLAWVPLTPAPDSPFLVGSRAGGQREAKRKTSEGWAGGLESWAPGQALLGLGHVTLGWPLPVSGLQCTHLHPSVGGGESVKQRLKGPLVPPTSAPSELGVWAAGDGMYPT